VVGLQTQLPMAASAVLDDEYVHIPLSQTPISQEAWDVGDLMEVHETSFSTNVNAEAERAKSMAAATAHLRLATHLIRTRDINGQGDTLKTPIPSASPMTVPLSIRWCGDLLAFS